MPKSTLHLIEIDHPIKVSTKQRSSLFLLFVVVLRVLPWQLFGVCVCVCLKEMSLGFVSSHCTLYGTRFGLQRNIRTVYMPLFSCWIVSYSCHKSRKRVVGPLAKPRMLLDILPLHESVNQLHYAAPMYLSSESVSWTIEALVNILAMG